MNAVRKPCPKLQFLFRFINEDQRHALKADEEALYSATDQCTADKITRDLVSVVGRVDAHVCDGTACMGGNTFSFARTFERVSAVELDVHRWQHFTHNMDVLGCRDVHAYQGDVCDVLPWIEPAVDLVFLDPPWGGPGYKKQSRVDLYMNNVPLDRIVLKHILPNTTYVDLKTPINFDLDAFCERTQHAMTKVHHNARLRKMHLVVFKKV